ncbi:hypothetical protein [Entomobacter blattae]|uniref:Uncharacterized protein n=1 Tax=Entomobacter blattae TaxID=2762277 RepID=A0A7H1NTR1_9PROT|nr:hypothetical protein [Entomobacter blattae]QNT79171.1 hypothetical protein JGUZn3_19660 [Entomobacter blattae]
MELELSWLEAHHPIIVMLIALGPVVMATLHGAIRLYFDYKRQKLDYEREREKKE